MDHDKDFQYIRYSRAVEREPIEQSEYELPLPYNGSFAATCSDGTFAFLAYYD
jgi:hypothetical protein